jgi:DNA-binding winged helix-turn-helix (wHTH) protein
MSKEELMAKVWLKTFVAPTNIPVHILALRRSLGDGLQGRRYVVNIPGRSYRFVAAVTVENDLHS